MKLEKYVWAGVLAILESRDKKKYIVLNKRTKDAPTNPGVYSGFFGCAENENESLFPKLTAHRELLEEIFISSKNKQNVYNLVFLRRSDLRKSTIEEPHFYTRRLIDLWKQEKGMDTSKNNIYSLNSRSIIKEVDFIEPEKDLRGKVFILNFELPLDIHDIFMFCGETREENPPKELLDRRIDVFNLENFKEWWINDNKKSVEAEVSFRGGERINNGIINSIDCISPNMTLILNKWWKD